MEVKQKQQRIYHTVCPRSLDQFIQYIIAMLNGPRLLGHILYGTVYLFKKKNMKSADINSKNLI